VQTNQNSKKTDKEGFFIRNKGSNTPLPHLKELIGCSKTKFNFQKNKFFKDVQVSAHTRYHSQCKKDQSKQVGRKNQENFSTTRDLNAFKNLPEGEKEKRKFYKDVFQLFSTIQGHSILLEFFSFFCFFVLNFE
jgi:hypothetical protein